MFLVNTKQEWQQKGMKKLGFYFTDEEIKNHKNGFIGERQGIRCYLTEYIDTSREKFNEKIKQNNDI